MNWQLARRSGDDAGGGGCAGVLYHRLVSTHTSPSNTGEETHIQALDGIRGLAILLVLACHSADVYTPHGRAHSTLTELLYRMMGAGWLGVDLFFLLSGFLITGILLKSKRNKSYFRHFYMRRFLRISPLYYLYVTAAVLLVFLRPAYRIVGPEVVAALTYTQNFYLAYTGHIALLLAHFWSLAVEEHFYLVWPMLIFVMSRKGVVRACATGIACSLTLRLVLLHWATMYRVVFYITPCRLDGLLVGAWLAVIYSKPEEWRRIQPYAVPVGAAAAALIAAIAIRQRHLFDYVRPNYMDVYHHSSYLILGPGLTVMAVLWGACLVYGISAGWARSWLSVRPLRLIGKYSYGMYVLHL